MTVTLLSVFMLGPVGAPAAGAGGDPAGDGLAAPVHLRCEYLVDPLGIDERWPRLSWEMVDTRRGAVQTAYQVLVADDPARLAADAGTLWDSGKVASDRSVQVVYDGRALCSRQLVWWKVRVWDRDGRPSPWSAPARWSMGLLEASDWQARWIGDAAPPPATGPDGAGYDPLVPPLLRKSFTLGDVSGVRRVTAYATALGMYDLHLNGRRVSDRELAPEWTDYRQRVQYQTYDLTGQVQAGENVVGALLGDGWYAGRIGLASIVPGGPPRAIYGRQPRFLMQLEIEYADGRVERIVTDGTWRSTTDGPLRVADLLDGVVYDAGRELPGWDAPGFDAAAWRPVQVCDPPPARLVAQRNEPVRVVRELRPVGLTEPRPGVYIFDLGQNMVGWCRLTVSGAAGQTVTLRHAEVLNPDGTLYTANLRSASQTDRYTLRGGGPETLAPRFTYHGFRYVELTGLDAAPSPASLTGCVVHSAAPEVGEFECSDSLLNRLWRNILWTQRANLHSVPTDCPQRDERLGWMGDILAFAQTACFNMDLAAFFTKWLQDVRDAQTADGRYPDFAPHPFGPAERFAGVPAWGDAGVFVPWCAYRNYGDTRLLEQHFESARRWVDWIRAENPDLLWTNRRGNDYGDWLNADTLKLEGWPTTGAGMPKDAFATAFFARSTELVARMAAVLGRTEDARRYAALAADIRAAFCRAYVQPDGRIAGDTQAGYAIALHFDLLPEALRPAAVQHMLAGFERYGGRISTGFHSTICLMNELMRWGHADQAWRLALSREMPSWGYTIDHGATTIWERWDGFVAGRGFQDPGMNSFAHYALGSVGEWLVRTALGINPDPEVPAYKHFVFRPQPGGGLTWARGAYRSIHGRIASAWRIDAGRITLELTVPANTSATVYVPAGDGAAVTESGQPLDQAPGVRLSGTSKGAVVCEVGAGQYRFEAPWPP